MHGEAIMEALVDVIVFFEISGPEIVNPDAAVAMLEQIAATLQSLDSGGKATLAASIRGRSAAAQSDRERAALQNLARDFG
jgi:hypothetical protein